MKPKYQRLLLIFAAFTGIGVAAFLMIIAFQDNLVFFYTPSDLLHKKVHPEQRIRVGGLVAFNSVHQEGERVHFTITDQKEALIVYYHGLLPDLFREGQGVVIEGHLLKPTEFQAETVLAKHDEKYMPKELADKLKQSGLWRDAQ